MHCNIIVNVSNVLMVVRHIKKKRFVSFDLQYYDGWTNIFYWLSNYLKIYLDIPSYISIFNYPETIFQRVTWIIRWPAPSARLLRAPCWRGECSLVLSVPRNPSSDASLLRACCWPGQSRPVRPVPSKTLLSPVLGTPQSSSLQPCVSRPRPGPNTDTRPRLAGSDTNTKNPHKQIGESRRCWELLRTVFTIRCWQRATQWVWAARGKQTRPWAA